MPTSRWRPFRPKLLTVLSEGYGFEQFRADAVAGLTVAIIALPLAMALGIASGSTPASGLVTAIVAGFLISALGGSRVQIGGPTGAFVVVVYGVLAAHGRDGLLLATVMAGLILVLSGFARVGSWIRYIPDPVITGFTAGIAVIIFSSQLRDLFGIEVATLPADFLEKCSALWSARATSDAAAMSVSAGGLALLLLLRRVAPRFPSFLAVVVASSLLVWAFGIPVETIGSRFGSIDASIPAPALPPVSLERISALVPSALTIAFLAGVESLLSAVVADGMTGRRHRSNTELVAQGVANLASALFGGLPATGAIARTATNIRSGARSPVAGMLHSCFLLLFLLTLAPLLAYVPLASLAAVLVLVAWNMSEVHRFRSLLAAPAGDRALLLLTFFLTVLVDLTVAIEAGVVLAAVLFMHRMAESVAIEGAASGLAEEAADDEGEGVEREALPANVEVFEVRGPLFFGVSGRILDLLDATAHAPPAFFVLRMREVPLMDASGERALTDFVKACSTRGTRVVLTELQPAVRELIDRMRKAGEGFTIATDLRAALKLAASA